MERDPLRAIRSWIFLFIETRGLNASSSNSDWKDSSAKMCIGASIRVRFRDRPGPPRALVSGFLWAKNWIHQIFGEAADWSPAPEANRGEICRFLSSFWPKQAKNGFSL